MNTTRFNIIDGDNNYLEKMPEFVELYNENYYTIPVICEMLQLKKTEYRKLRKHCLEEGLITLRKRENRKIKKGCKTHPKHYSRRVSKGWIYYVIYKNSEYYGTCKTEKQAQEIVQRLKAVNWDKSKFENIKEMVMLDAE